GPGDVRPAAVRRVAVRRDGFRPWLWRADRRGAEPGGVFRGRADLGRRGEHRVLDRSARGTGRGVLHPVAAVQYLPDPPTAPPARLPGADRLTRARSFRYGTIREDRGNLMPRIVVVGGGLVGLATAMMLAEDSCEVTVLERDGDAVPGSPGDAWRGWDGRGRAVRRGHR